MKNAKFNILKTVENNFILSIINNSASSSFSMSKNENQTFGKVFIYFLIIKTLPLSFKKCLHNVFLSVKLAEVRTSLRIFSDVRSGSVLLFVNPRITTCRMESSFIKKGIRFNCSVKFQKKKGDSVL